MCHVSRVMCPVSFFLFMAKFFTEFKSYVVLITTTKMETNYEEKSIMFLVLMVYFVFSWQPPPKKING